MKVLVEGEKYSLELLEKLIDPRFYKTFGLEGIISHVGYFYSYVNNEIVYVLPKVFINENKIILFHFEKDKLANYGFYLNEHKNSDSLKHLLILFYRSLQEYKKRQPLNTIINKDESLILDSNIGDKEYSYLDIVLNIVNFHKENKNIVLFMEKNRRSKQHKKVNWAKTINKTLPYIDSNKNPIYIQPVNKKKIIDSEEELLSLFYSVLWDLKDKYKFNITIDKIYKIHTGKSFLSLCKKAPKILRKIKHKYFSDTLVKIYNLLEIYFNSSSTAKSSNKAYEFIRVDNYHIIFEDMIDKLFSDKLPDNLQKLKEQKDGKEIDHIFKYDALLNSKEQIFYIGDSKYYKTGSSIGENSKYKQFTYAKNVIQFNVGIMNGKKENIEDKSLRYRDDLTEGYNISPNFFIQGKIFEDMNFDKAMINISSNKNEPEISYHFENRIFDRDTLFVHYYDINFLFVLKAYTQINSMKLKEFRNKCKNKFRKTLVDYLNKKYHFYTKTFDNNEELKLFVDKNFRELIGKIYCKEESQNALIYASLSEDCYLEGFNKFELTN
ncbi:hypothetical protein [Aliarcobacter butzleri]|uniref:hypothetical protein n=1 Tax=Aliarcobacter butzleri TaxID=28197 RepID=UPI000F4A9446|nr:hypothetical protein [Aliarcobacter butzleri]